jgi:hypothetical protein
MKRNNCELQSKEQEQNRFRKNEIILDLDTPILRSPPWHLLLLVLGILLALHPIGWILLLHINKEEHERNFFTPLLEIFSEFLLTKTAKLASSSFTIVIACYILFVAWTKLFPIKFE